MQLKLFQLRLSQSPMCTIKLNLDQQVHQEIKDLREEMEKTELMVLKDQRGLKVTQGNQDL